MPLLILVADDDPGIRLSISQYLELVGYGTVTAQNGLEALKRVEEYQPQLLITDVLMPLMDGYELVRRIRQKPMFRLLPVVFLTARNSTKERIQGYQAGCDVYLPKPFELEELGVVIRNLLERLQVMQWSLQVQSLRNVEIPEMPQTGLPQPVVSLTKEGNGESSVQDQLTRREWEVLNLLTEGLSNNQIGEQLHLSPRTVEKYVSSLLRKTITNNRAELVRFAVKHHLVT